MSSFVPYMLFVVAIIVSIPLGVAILSEAGLDIDATIPGGLDEYAAPNMENYVPNTDSQLDMALATLTWAFTSLIWVFTLILKVVLIYPILTEFFGVDPLFATPVSILIGISVIFFLYRVFRNQDLEGYS